MALRFTNLRKPTRLTDFDETQRRQLEICARLYFGDAQPLASRFGGEDDDPEQSFCFIELWDIEEDGVHCYDAFLYNVDSGTVFTRGTTEVVAEMIQCYFDQARDEAFEKALQSAYRDACAAQRTSKKTAAKKTPAKKAPAKKTAAKKTPAKKAAAKKTPARKTPKRASLAR